MWYLFVDSSDWYGLLGMVDRVNSIKSNGISRKDKVMMLGVKVGPCPWCVLPTKGDEEMSHGICDDHIETMRTQSAQRQFDKIPSYVGERKAFESYKERRRK